VRTGANRPARTRALTALPERSRTKTPPRSFDLVTARAPARLLLAARSRTRAFEPPGRPPGTGHHPGSSSPSPISGSRRCMGHVASGMSSRDTRPRCVVSRLRITLPGAGPPGFQAAECRSSALPIGRVRSLFGTVSHASHQQALAGLSPLNFSRPRGFPPVPGLVITRSVRLAAAELPALARVERTRRRRRLARTPQVDWAARPVALARPWSTTTGEPVARVHARAGQARRGRVHAASPTSSSTAARSCTTRSVSVVPPPKRGITMR
jgi:hypothetical protein